MVQCKFESIISILFLITEIFAGDCAVYTSNTNLNKNTFNPFLLSTSKKTIRSYKTKKKISYNYNHGQYLNYDQKIIFRKFSTGWSIPVNQDRQITNSNARLSQKRQNLLSRSTIPHSSSSKTFPSTPTSDFISDQSTALKTNTLNLDTESSTKRLEDTSKITLSAIPESSDAKLSHHLLKSSTYTHLKHSPTSFSSGFTTDASVSHISTSTRRGHATSTTDSSDDNEWDELIDDARKNPIPFYVAGAALVCLVILGVFVVVSFWTKRKRELLLSYTNSNYVTKEDDDINTSATELERSDSFTFEHPGADFSVNVICSISEQTKDDYVH